MQAQFYQDLVWWEVPSHDADLANNLAEHLYLPEDGTGQKQHEREEDPGITFADHGPPPQSEKGPF
jgi:hypothetical protein